MDEFRSTYIILGGSSPTAPGENSPFLFTPRFSYIANSNVKEWDLLTIERNGEMLSSAEKEEGRGGGGGGGVNIEMKFCCKFCRTDIFGNKALWSGSHYLYWDDSNAMFMLRKKKKKIIFSVSENTKQLLVVGVIL